MSEKSAAILTIKGAGRMSPKGRKAIVAWLRRQASFLAQHSKDYSTGRFTARYLYR